MKLRFNLAALLLALSLPIAARADTFEVDPVHSAVIFKAVHLGASNAYGRFNDISGKVVTDEASPEKNTIELTINVASVDTNSKDRDAHLTGPDFFNAKEFPTATFKSTAVKKTGENTFDVTGDFTLKGVTKSITVPFTKIGEGANPRGGYVMGGEAKFTFKRSDYGIDYLVQAISDEVEMTVAIEAMKK